MGIDGNRSGRLNSNSKNTNSFLKKDVAKNLTLAILAIGFVMGNIGSWFEAFSMEKYVSFIGAFTPMYLGLIVSIGGNSVVEKMKGKENDRD